MVRESPLGREAVSEKEEGEEGQHLDSGRAVVWNFATSTRHALVATATGGTYFEDFVLFSLPFWRIYAEKHDLAIVVVRDSSFAENLPVGPGGAWLKMLIPTYVRNLLPSIERLALVDTDVIMNPSAPNVFEFTPPGQIGVVSQTQGLPFDLLLAKKRMAYLRKSYYAAQYPLDSLLFATPEQIFVAEGLDPHPDSFCSGLVVLDVLDADLFARWYREVDGRVLRKANAWEQTYLNHKVLEHGCNWMPYEFQAIWNLEMAVNHPALYILGNLEGALASRLAVSSTLVNRFFLHFAGSWPESWAWRNDPIETLRLVSRLTSSDFDTYLAKAPTGQPVGKVASPERGEDLRGLK